MILLTGGEIGPPAGGHSMKTLDVINGLNVALPCQAPWNGMKGDDRSRFCSLCDKHVYNIASLTSQEVVELIERTEGDFCGRLHRRRDGTVLTADCPVGARAFSSGRLHRVMTYGVLGLAFVATGAFLKAASERESHWPPTGPSVTFADWRDWALRTLGFARVGSPSIAGGICVPGKMTLPSNAPSVPPPSPVPGGVPVSRLFDTRFPIAEAP